MIYQEWTIQLACIVDLEECVCYCAHLSGWDMILVGPAVSTANTQILVLKKSLTIQLPSRPQVPPMICAIPRTPASVMAQVTDLHNHSGNLDTNCIIRYILIKWTSHPPGICSLGVSLAFKGSGIKKYVCSKLATCLLTI